MKTFMGRNFLLPNEKAKKLYHEYAEDLPIIDYHCHINPKEICEDRKFRNITEAWLEGDHYKWRLMRANGVPERYIPGDAPAREKFQKYAETLERAIGNPLYHWSHLELRKYFGYEGILSGETAETVWQLTEAMLQEDSMSVRNLIRRSDVEVLCTTDDPKDSLEYHKKLHEDPMVDFKVYPAWRPDRAMNLEKNDYPDYLRELSEAAGKKIGSYDALLSALDKRMAFFHANGCRISDHGLDSIPFEPVSREECDRIFRKRLGGEIPDPPEIRKFKTGFLLEMGERYARLGWVMQMHYGAVRNTNSKMFRLLGPDTGYDCIGDSGSAAAITGLLNALHEKDALPKTILYALNPADNAMLDAVTGCFQDDSARGKIQHGAAWWFNDHRAGMREQLTSLASLGLLGSFVGMLTDSRSFLSYTRHEYFRRVLCGLIGEWVSEGEYPDDPRALEKLIEDICYYNARKYFDFP